MDTGGVEWLQCVPPLEKALNSYVSVHVYQLVSGRVRCGHTDSLEYMLYGSTQYVAAVSTVSAPVVCPPVLRAVCVVRRLPAGKSLLIWVLLQYVPRIVFKYYKVLCVSSTGTMWGTCRAPTGKVFWCVLRERVNMN